MGGCFRGKGSVALHLVYDVHTGRQQNDCQSVKKASVQCVCTAQMYRLLEAIKSTSCLDFCLTGFCFDSFYFITYLCLNEEKHTLTSKEICTSLCYFVLCYIFFVLFQSLIHYEDYHYC